MIARTPLTALLAAVVLALSVGSALASPRVEKGDSVLLGVDWPIQHLVRVDLDGDGRQEIALLKSSFLSRHLFVLQPEDSTGRFKVVASREVTQDPGVGGFVQSLQRVTNPQGGGDLIAVQTTSSIDLYEGNSLNLAGQHSILFSQSGILTVADMDADGSLDVLSVSEFPGLGISVYRFGTDEAIWSDPELAATFAGKGQLDADPALEIVTTSGLIVDGATGETEFEFAGGFGSTVLVGNVDSDSGDEIVGLVSNSQGTTATIFDTQPVRPVSQTALADRLFSPSLFDFNRDGVSELWGGTAIQDLVRFRTYQLPDGGLIADIPMPPGAPDHIGPISLDSELQVGAYSSSGPLGLSVTGVNGVRVSHMPFFNSTFVAMDVGKVTANGDQQLVTISANAGSGRIARMYSASSGAELAMWEGTSHSNVSRYRDVFLAQLDADPALEVVIAGATFNNEPFVFARDPVSGLIQWERYGSGGLSAPRGYRYGTTVEDPTTGNVDVVLVGETPNGQLNLDAFAGSTGVFRWDTFSVGSFALPLGVFATDILGTSQTNIVLQSDIGLWSYGPGGEFEWSKPLGHRFFGFDEERQEYFAETSTPEGVALDLRTRQLGVPFALPAVSRVSMIPLGEGFYLSRLVSGQLEIINSQTMSVQSLDFSVSSADIGINPIPWTIAATPYAGEKTLILATGYGFETLRMLDAGHIFGGSAGGFEE